MSTTTEEPAESRTDAGKSADIVDGLNDVHVKLAALVAAGRSIEGPVEGRGISHIAHDLEVQVRELMELARGVNVSLRENGDEPRGNRARKSGDADDLFDVLGVAHTAIGLASDGELENTFEREARAIWKSVYKHIDHVYDPALKARGRSHEEDYRVCSNTLRDVVESQGVDS